MAVKRLLASGANFDKRIIRHDAAVALSGQVRPVILVVFVPGELLGPRIHVAQHPERVVALAVEWISLAQFQQAAPRKPDSPALNSNNALRGTGCPPGPPEHRATSAPPPAPAGSADISAERSGTRPRHPPPVFCRGRTFPSSCSGPLPPAFARRRPRQEKGKT